MWSKEFSYRLSRKWNRVAYAVIDLGYALIWDFTGHNKDLLKEDQYSTVREILTTTPKRIER